MTEAMELHIPSTDEATAVLADWLIRALTPLALLTVQLDEPADRLSTLPPITADVLRHPGLLRKYVTAAHRASDDAEALRWQEFQSHAVQDRGGWRYVGGGGYALDNSADPRLLLGKVNYELANEIRREMLPGRSGWWAYRALHAATQIIHMRNDQDYVTLLRSGAAGTYSILLQKLFALKESELIVGPPGETQ